ncbi:MAG: hypothetical protein ACTTKZ_03120 [Bacteroides sp.]|jgi:hypothetical protein
MTRYERLKEKQKAALIVVLTLGLIKVPFLAVWRNSLFEGTSFEQTNKFLFNLLSFTLVSLLIAIPAFFFYLIVLIVVTIQLATI